MSRYSYLGNRLTDPDLRGLQCDPVRDPDGKCIRALQQRGFPSGIIDDGRVRIEWVKGEAEVKRIRSMGTALVTDGVGGKYVVVARRLRLNQNSPQEENREGE